MGVLIITALRHCGHFPEDAALQIVNQQPQGASEVIVVLGLPNRTEERAHSALSQLAGLNVSAYSVQRIAEAIMDNAV